MSVIVLTYDTITNGGRPTVRQPLWNKSQRQSHFSWRPSRDHCFWVAANFRFRRPHDFRVSHATAPSAHVDYHRVTGQWSKRSLIPREMWTRAQRNSNFPEAINVSDCGSQTRLRLISSGWQITLHIRVFAVPTLRAAPRRRQRQWPTTLAAGALCRLIRFCCAGFNTKFPILAKSQGTYETIKPSRQTRRGS